MRILAIITGVILLLPGICSLIAPAIFFSNDTGIGAVIFVFGLLVTWLAGWLIVKAGRR